MKKITGILVLLFLMVCSMAAASRPEFRSNVRASKWLQVKDEAIEVTDKDGLILKVQYPVFSSKDSSHGHLIASLQKESEETRSFFDKDIRESKELAAKGNRDVRNGRWLVYVELIRDDERVLSLLQRSFHRDFAGERWGYAGLNFDASTGEKLTSLDVFNLSKEELADTLVKRLTKAYGREKLGDNPRRTILYLISNDSGMEFLPWVITSEGVSFYFRTGDFNRGYEPLPIHINFRDEPHLFHKHYLLAY
jgi:hypothetical protein